MSYTIDERNAERQQLLAAILEPPTREVLAKLPEVPNAKCLDLGCGQGNTTRLLAEVIKPAEVVGIEYDNALVEYAAQAESPPCVRFEQGDATRLTFADGTFDIVFCRFLLIHMADPLHVIGEMLRVVKPGGYVVAFEADFAIDISYPVTPATTLMNKVWQGVFQNPSIGRRLVPLFKQAGASNIQAGAFMQLEHDESTLKRTYRLTAEATGVAAEAKGILSAEEVRTMIEGLRALENDPASVMMRFPDVWVMARRALQ